MGGNLLQLVSSHPIKIDRHAPEKGNGVTGGPTRPTRHKTGFADKTDFTNNSKNYTCTLLIRDQAGDEGHFTIDTRDNMQKLYESYADLVGIDPNDKGFLLLVRYEDLSRYVELDRTSNGEFYGFRNHPCYIHAVLRKFSFPYNPEDDATIKIELSNENRQNWLYALRPSTKMANLFDSHEAREKKRVPRQTCEYILRNDKSYLFHPLKVDLPMSSKRIKLLHRWETPAQFGFLCCADTLLIDCKTNSVSDIGC